MPRTQILFVQTGKTAAAQQWSEWWRPRRGDICCVARPAPAGDLHFDLETNIWDRKINIPLGVYFVLIDPGGTQNNNSINVGEITQ